MNWVTVEILMVSIIRSEQVGLTLAVLTVPETGDSEGEEALYFSLAIITLVPTLTAKMYWLP